MDTLSFYGQYYQLLLFCLCVPVTFPLSDQITAALRSGLVVGLGIRYAGAYSYCEVRVSGFGKPATLAEKSVTLANAVLNMFAPVVMKRFTLNSVMEISMYKP